MSRKATATREEATPAPNIGDDSGIDLSLDIINIEELQNHGINMSDIQKLKSAGIHSISVRKIRLFRKSNLIFQTVLSTTRRNMIKIKGLSEIKVEKIKEAGKKIMVGLVEKNYFQS